MKSTDGGVTWTTIAQDYFTGLAIGSLAVSPSNSQVLLAGGIGGLYISSDGGITWANRVSNFAATAVAFNPADGAEAWAGVCSIFLDQSNGLYHSTDGGVTWMIVSAAPLPQSGIGRLAIAIAPSNPKTIYVGMSGVIPNDTKFLGIFVSTDGGTTWTSNASGYRGDWYVWAAAAGSIPGVNASPVSAGDFITIFCTGLGPVTNQPATRAPAPSSPLAVTTQGVIVNIGGVPVFAPFAGLVSGLVGFYQVNARVPAGVAASNSVAVFLTIGGVIPTL